MRARGIWKGSVCLAEREREREEGREGEGEVLYVCCRGVRGREREGEEGRGRDREEWRGGEVIHICFWENL